MIVSEQRDRNTTFWSTLPLLGSWSIQRPASTFCPCTARGNTTAVHASNLASDIGSWRSPYATNTSAFRRRISDFTLIESFGTDVVSNLPGPGQFQDQPVVSVSYVCEFRPISSRSRLTLAQGSREQLAIAWSPIETLSSTMPRILSSRSRCTRSNKGGHAPSFGH